MHLNTVDFMQINEYALFILIECQHSFLIFLRFFTKLHDGLNYSVPIMSLQEWNEKRIS